MAELSEQKIPGLHAAEALARAATAANDQLIAEILLPRRRNGFIAARLFLDLDHIARRHDRHAALLHREAQHIEHARRLIAQRIDLAVRLCHGQKSQRTKIVQRPLHAEAFQRRFYELRRSPMIVRSVRAKIRQVAAAIARGQQLAAHAALPLEQHHAVRAVLRRAQRGHHSAGPAANDQDFHARPPLLKNEYYLV